MNVLGVAHGQPHGSERPHALRLPKALSKRDETEVRVFPAGGCGRVPDRRPAAAGRPLPPRPDLPPRAPIWLMSRAPAAVEQYGPRLRALGAALVLARGEARGS